MRKLKSIYETKKAKLHSIFQYFNIIDLKNMYIKKCLQIQNNFSTSTKIGFKLKCDGLGFSISLKFIVHQYLFWKIKGGKKVRKDQMTNAEHIVKNMTKFPLQLIYK